MGPVLALSGTATGLLIQGGVPVAPAMALGVAAGALCGAFIGIVITNLRNMPFVATLRMMLIARGIALQLTGAASIARLGDAFSLLGAGALFRAVEMRDNGFPRVVFPGSPTR